MTGQPTADRRRVLVAANPFSGPRRKGRLVEELLGALRAESLEPVVIWDKAERAARLREGDWRCVVVAAGDGTVNDVVNECLDVPLTALPLGTENLFARQFGCGLDLGRLARAVSRLQCRAIDIGEFTGPAGARRFVLMVTAGSDAEVVRRVAESRGRGNALSSGGYAVYPLPILKTALTYRWPRIRIEADGIAAEGAHLLVFNVNQYALRLSFAPDAREDDGLLDWVLFTKGGAFAALSALWSVSRGSHLRRPDVFHGRARRIRIEGGDSVPLEIDGDAAGFAPGDLRANPGALRVVCID
jgi:diacylglycerol kinase family enzyme